MTLEAVPVAWFHGRGLVVKLDGGEARAREERVPQEYYQLLLGGRGLGVLLWALHAGPRDPPSPLDPSNPLVISPGGLVGSPLSTASKTAFVARSPQTGLLGRAMAGGRIGWELRKAGSDYLVITGGLEEPGILIVDDDGARVEPAGSLWGLTIGEARRRLQEEYKGYADAIIGPAGENKSRIAMIDANGRQAGRTGLGAVMGSKNLKAILVKGRGTLRPAEPEKAREIARRLNRETREHPASKALVEYGTPIILDYTNKKHGVLPSLNWKRSTLSWCPDPEKAHAELSRFAPRHRVSRNPCTGCGRPCSQVLETAEGRVDGPEYETVYALGTNIGMCSIQEIASLNKLADELGFDTISLGATIAWAIHAGEEGIIEGPPGWGDYEAIRRLIIDMAHRRGTLGSLLADGVRAAVERLGGRGGELAVHVKGLEPPAYDARGLRGMALGYAVASRGADHLTSGAYAFELPGSLWRFSGVDRLSYEGKALLVKAGEDLMAFYDNTGICKFSRYTLHPENVAPLWRAVTGIDLAPGDLLEAGERTVTLERLVNLWLGLNPERDDALPERLYSEPISDGPSRGQVIDKEAFNAMRREYYASRGWNSTGIPANYTLLRLGLEEILPGHLKALASPGLR